MTAKRGARAGLFGAALAALYVAAAAAFACGGEVDDASATATGGAQGTGASATSGGSTSVIVDNPPAAAAFDGATVEVVLEVDAQAGAEPYFEWGANRTGNPWDLTRDNLRVLLNSDAVVLPKSVADVGAVDGVVPAQLTVDDLLTLAARSRNETTVPGSAVFHVLFVDATLVVDGVPRDDVLGANIGNTGVVAMFKPVIASTGRLSRFVEQLTLVHELGHALGLVNNGLPMVNAHQDAEHGAHCSNPDCIMYWENEGAADVLGYLAKAETSGVVVLFDDDCLRDAQNALEASGRGGTRTQ